MEQDNNNKPRLSSEILEEADGNFYCKECNYMSKNKRLLISHLKRHSVERPFPCNFPGCAYRSKWSHWARAHERKVHSDEKPYACAVKGCDYRTKWTWALKGHMKHHDRPIKKRQRNNKQRFSREILAQPDGAFHCKECDYANKNKRLLLSHMRCHSEERPFPCTFPGCAYRSKWSHWARAHERKVHHITRAQQIKYKVQQGATRALTNVKSPRVQVTKLVQKSRAKETPTTLSREKVKCPQYERKCYRYFLRNHLKVNYGEKPVGRSAKGCNYQTKRLTDLKNHKTRRVKVPNELPSSARKKPLVVVQPEVDKELNTVNDDNEMEGENNMEISMEPAEELADSFGYACTLCDFVGYSEAAALNHSKFHTQPFFSHDKLNEIPAVCLD